MTTPDVDTQFCSGTAIDQSRFRWDQPYCAHIGKTEYFILNRDYKPPGAVTGAWVEYPDVGPTDHYYFYKDGWEFWHKEEGDNKYAINHESLQQYKDRVRDFKELMTRAGKTERTDFR